MRKPRNRGYLLWSWTDITAGFFEPHTIVFVVAVCATVSVFVIAVIRSFRSVPAAGSIDWLRRSQKGLIGRHEEDGQTQHAKSVEVCTYT